MAREYCRISELYESMADLPNGVKHIEGIEPYNFGQSVFTNHFGRKIRLFAASTKNITHL